MPGLGKIGQIIVEITASNSKLKAGLAEASSAIRDWSLVTTGLTAGITNAFKTIADVGIKSVVAGLAALTGTFVLVAKSGADFEDAITRAFVVLKEGAGATDSDLKALTETAMKMGNETLFSATEAADGLLILAKAGFDAKDSITALKPIVDLAITGDLSLAAATDVAVASMYEFGLQAKDVTRIVDVLAVAANLSNMEVTDVGTALRYVGPVAHAAGMSIEETAAALDILANSGIRGSMGGTVLRGALSKLLNPTGEAEKIFKQLGLTFTDTSGDLVPFVEIIKKLEKASLSAGQMMEIFGLRAGPGMQALVAQGSSELEKMTKSLEGAEGAADRMSQAFKTTVKGRLQEFKAVLVNFGLGFSENFKKPLAEAIGAISNYVRSITEAWKQSGVFKAIVEGILNALSPLIEKIKEVAEALKAWLISLKSSDVISFFDNIKTKVQGFIDIISSSQFKDNIIAAFNGAKAAIAPFLASIDLIAKSFDNLPKTMQPLVAAITSFGATLVWLMGGIQNIITLLIVLGALFNYTSIKMLASAAAATLFGKGTLTAAWNASLLAKVLTGLGAVFTWVGGVATAAFAGLIAFFSSTLGIIVLIVAAIAGIGYAILKITGKWGDFKKWVVDAWSTLTGWIKQANTSIEEFLTGLGPIGEALKYLGKLGELVWLPFKLLGELVSKIDFSKWGEGIKGFLKSLKDAFAGMFGGTKENFENEMKGVKLDTKTLDVATKVSKTEDSTKNKKVDSKGKAIVDGFGAVDIGIAKALGVTGKKGTGKDDAAGNLVGSNFTGAQGLIKENGDKFLLIGDKLVSMNETMSRLNTGLETLKKVPEESKPILDQQLQPLRDTLDLFVGAIKQSPGIDTTAKNIVGTIPTSNIEDPKQRKDMESQSFADAVKSKYDAITKVSETSSKSSMLGEITSGYKQITQTLIQQRSEDEVLLQKALADVKELQAKASLKQGKDETKTNSPLGAGLSNVTSTGCH